jgi:hypothetical protein
MIPFPSLPSRKLIFTHTFIIASIVLFLHIFNLIDGGASPSDDDILSTRGLLQGVTEYFASYTVTLSDPVTSRMCRQGLRILNNLSRAERSRWEAQAPDKTALPGSLGDVIRHAGELGVEGPAAPVIASSGSGGGGGGGGGGPVPPPGSFDLGAGADSGTTEVLRSLGLLDNQVSLDGFLDPAAMASLNVGMSSSPTSLSTDDLAGLGTDLGASWATGIW